MLLHSQILCCVNTVSSSVQSCVNQHALSCEHFTCKKLQHTMFTVPRVCEVTFECRILGFDITDQIFLLFSSCATCSTIHLYLLIGTAKPRLDQFSLIEQSPMNAMIALLESMCVVSNQVLKVLDLLCRYAERINYLMVNSFGPTVCLSIFSILLM